MHEVTTIRPKSGQTVYLAGGAILRAKIAPGERPVQEKNWRGNKVYATLIEATGVKGVKVRGRGILDLGTLPWHARTAMWFDKSEDVLVEGIAILDAPAWVVAMHNSKNVVVRNVKQICARENSDGVDICNSQDVLVEDCFLRNNDDEVCVKTVSPPPAMESNEGLRIQGKPIQDAAAARLQTNAYVRKIQFIPAPGQSKPVERQP